MRIAIDTNRYTDHAAGRPETASVFANADEIVIPFAVLAELHHGFRAGGRRVENEAKLARFLAKPATYVVFADLDTVEVWATLNADLQRRGRKLPHNDVWIAAICVQHGLRLYSRDGHFDELPQVVRA